MKEFPGVEDANNSNPWESSANLKVNAELSCAADSAGLLGEGLVISSVDDEDEKQTWRETSLLNLFECMLDGDGKKLVKQGHPLANRQTAMIGRLERGKS